VLLASVVVLSQVKYLPKKKTTKTKSLQCSLRYQALNGLFFLFVGDSPGKLNKSAKFFNKSRWTGEAIPDGKECFSAPSDAATWLLSETPAQSTSIISSFCSTYSKKHKKM
jgi:hypothetical protein